MNATVTSRPWYNLAPLRHWIGFVLIACALTQLIYAGQAYRLIGLIDAAYSGQLSDIEWTAQAERLDSHGAMLTVLSVASLIFSYVLGCIWTYRASSNARQLSPETQQITPGRAVGWYFVPLANLWKPFSALKQVYNSSAYPARATTAPVPSLFGWWWAGWIIAIHILPSISLLMSRSPDLNVLRSSLVLDLFNTPLTLITIYLWWRVVSTITVMQAGGTVAPDPAADNFIANQEAAS